MLGGCQSVQEEGGSSEMAEKSCGVAIMKKPPSEPLTSPPTAKKLKQARLPFKCLDPKPPTGGKVLPLQQKKRKTSDGAAGPQKFAKVQKNDDNIKIKCPHRQEDEENEVSSSSEADVIPRLVSSIEKPKGLLDRYIRTTQQLEVSTSCPSDVIDLTDSSDGFQEPSTEVANSPCSALDSSPNKETPKTPTHKENETCMVKEPFTNKDEVEKSGLSSSQSSEKDASNTHNEVGKEPPCPEPYQESDCNTTVNDSICDKSILSDNGMDVSDFASQSINTSTEASDGDSSEGESDGEEQAEKPSQNKVSDASPSTKVAKSKPKVKQVKSAAKEAERKKHKEEKEKILEEKKKQKELERQKKEEARQEKERQKKEEKEHKEAEKARKEKERQEKVAEKEKEKEEKQRQRDEEKRKKQGLIDAKNEEKKRKEEEKEAERKKKEEGKVRLEEEKNKKIQQTQAVFKNFFKKLDKPMEAPKVTENIGPFAAFEITKNMRMAPTGRVQKEIIEEKKMKLETAWNSEKCSKLYIEELKSEEYRSGSSSKTFPEDKEDVIAVDETGIEQPAQTTMRAKLLQFHENYRPAYYGTWRRRSERISPRNPLKKDEVLLDYEVHSDDEWEEEEPGESLSHSEGEGEENGSDEDEDEDGFFVPHGYLSDGEGCEDEDQQDLSPEAVKARQMIKTKTWEAEMKQQCKVLKALVIGCQWWNPASNPSTHDANHNKLLEYKVQPLVEGTIMPKPLDQPTRVSTKKVAKLRKDPRVLKNSVPEEALPHLIKLIHGNVASYQKLVKEFREFWRVHQRKVDDTLPAQETSMEVDSQPSSLNSSQSESLNASPADGNEPVSEEKHKCFMSKRQLDIKIHALAVYEKRSTYNYRCWYVHQTILEKEGLLDLPVPTQWTWLTRPNVPSVPLDNASTPAGRKTSRETNTTSTPTHPSIKKFTVPGISPQTHPAPQPVTKSTSAVTTSAQQGKSAAKNKNSGKAITQGHIYQSLFTQMAKSSVGVQKEKEHSCANITPGKTQQCTSTDESLQSMELDEDDCMIVGESFVPPPSSKNQPTLTTMFAKKA